MPSTSRQLLGALVSLLAVQSATAITIPILSLSISLPAAVPTGLAAYIAAGYNDAAAASSILAAIGETNIAAVTKPLSINTARPSATAIIQPKKPTPSARGGNSASSYSGPAFLANSKNHSTAPALSQSVTNGASILGTLLSPNVSPFLSGPLVSGFPWGTRTASNTNYYDTSAIPNTGVTRSYTWSVTQQTIAPDGVSIPGIVVNGAYPGPLIEANWGDWISVTVTNNLPSDGTSIHWHGLLQKATPYYDGVPSIGQCPIAPGSTYTYRFRAELYGTSWWHSHYSAQYAGGLAGPMIIHGPTHVPYDIDLGPVMVNDWFHDSYQNLVSEVMSENQSGSPGPVSNNCLINGKMNYPCDSTSTTCVANAGLSKFRFTAGKKHRLRLINAGAEATQKFSIDGHQMTVIAYDYVPIVPYQVDVVTLGVGQRADIVVTANGTVNDSYWMRSNISQFCSLNDGISGAGMAVILYDKADNNTVPTSTSIVTDAEMNVCGNDALSLTVPFYPLTPTTTPALTQVVNMVDTINSTGYDVYEVNGNQFHANYNDPLLLEAKLGKTNFSSTDSVYNFGAAKTYRLVVYNYFQPGGHPMHLHGHNFYVLAEGQGAWDGTVVNPANPLRRDTHLIQPMNSDTVPSYLVLQVDADNPGVWPFHCHIAWHASQGLWINILERPADITEMEIPMVAAQTCQDWSAWSKKNVVNEIDSGE